MHSVYSYTHRVCSLYHTFKPGTYTQSSSEAWNNPPLSRCKSCKRLIGTTSNLGCRGKNILVKYFSAFIKHLSSTLCLIEWQGSFSQRLTDICSAKINVFGGVPAKCRAQHLGVTQHPVVSLWRCSSISYLQNASLGENSMGGVLC